MKKLIPVSFLILLFCISVAASEVDFGDEKRADVLSDPLGVQIKMLQLEKSIYKNVYSGSAVLNYTEENHAEGVYILEEMRALINNITNYDYDNQTEEAARDYLAFRQKAKDLTRDFRENVSRGLTEEEREKVREYSQNKSSKLQGLKEDIQLKIQNYNAQQTQHLLEKHEEGEKLLEKIQYGELSVQEARERIKEFYEEASAEKREEMINRLRQLNEEREEKQRKINEEVSRQAEEKYKELEEQMKERYGRLREKYGEGKLTKEEVIKEIEKARERLEQVRNKRKELYEESRDLPEERRERMIQHILSHVETSEELRERIEHVEGLTQEDIERMREVFERKKEPVDEVVEEYKKGVEEIINASDSLEEAKARIGEAVGKDLEEKMEEVINASDSLEEAEERVGVSIEEELEVREIPDGELDVGELPCEELDDRGVIVLDSEREDEEALLLPEKPATEWLDEDALPGDDWFIRDDTWYLDRDGRWHISGIIMDSETFEGEVGDDWLMKTQDKASPKLSVGEYHGEELVAIVKGQSKDQVTEEDEYVPDEFRNLAEDLYVGEEEGLESRERILLSGWKSVTIPPSSDDDNLIMGDEALHKSELGYEVQAGLLEEIRKETFLGEDDDNLRVVIGIVEEEYVPDEFRHLAEELYQEGDYEILIGGILSEELNETDGEQSHEQIAVEDEASREFDDRGIILMAAERVDEALIISGEPVTKWLEKEEIPDEWLMEESSESKKTKISEEVDDRGVILLGSERDHENRLILFDKPVTEWLDEDTLPKDDWLRRDGSWYLDREGTLSLDSIIMEPENFDKKIPDDGRTVVPMEPENLDKVIPDDGRTVVPMEVSKIEIDDEENIPIIGLARGEDVILEEKAEQFDIGGILQDMWQTLDMAPAPAVIGLLRDEEEKIRAIGLARDEEEKIRSIDFERDD